jgi:hypothetical protein
LSIILNSLENVTITQLLKYLKNLRKVINLAVKNEWLEKDPFQKFKSKIIEVKRDYITKEELQRLEDLKLSFSRLEVVKDIFIFSVIQVLHLLMLLI